MKFKSHKNKIKRRAAAEEDWVGLQRTTAKSQNACRRRNTGTSAVLRDVTTNAKKTDDTARQ
jgi:hypothetical protein